MDASDGAELNNATLHQLPPHVSIPPYDRARLRPGIVHLSVGNFHRAHQAFYLDRLLAEPGHEDWAICGVGLLDDAAERDKAESFPRQDNLYTLTICPPEGQTETRVIGSITRYMFAPTDPEAVVERMADPAIRIVSMTITEGGYNQDKEGAYRLDNPVTVAELADPAHPRSAFGFIVAALRRRRDAGVAPFTVLSCDNLRNNGAVARDAVLAHAGALDGELAGWIAARVAFPSSMVDRITPATRPADLARLNAASGVGDRLPVFAEDFVQWVVEDRFGEGGRPAIERVGAQMVDDVHPYELAKVRMLNGSHQMLAYPAQLLGLDLVDEAMRERRIRGLLERFMTDDIMPMLSPPPGMPLAPYRDKLLSRFSNPAIRDQLPRLTLDSAGKLPVYVVPTIADLLERRADTSRLSFLLACWFRYLGGRDDTGREITLVEPNLPASELALARDPDGRAGLRMALLAELRLEAHPDFAAAVLRDRAALAARGTAAVLDELLAAP